MSDAFKELAEIPRDFVKDGVQFLNRCTKRGFQSNLQLQILCLYDLRALIALLSYSG